MLFAAWVTRLKIQRFAQWMHVCMLCELQNKRKLFPCIPYIDFTTETECLLRGTAWVLNIIQVELNFQEVNPPAFILFYSCTETENVEVLKTLCYLIYIQWKMNKYTTFLGLMLNIPVGVCIQRLIFQFFRIISQKQHIKSVGCD
jgi:hypothetical protein